MATVKVKFRPSAGETGEGAVFYRVIHDRVVRQVTPGYKLSGSDWELLQSDQLAALSSGKRKSTLVSLKRQISDDLFKFNKVISGLDSSGEPYTADDVISSFMSKETHGDFISFIRDIIHQLRHVGRVRTAETYSTTLNSFSRFCSIRGDVDLDEVDSALMMEYENYLKSSGLIPNTISFYMRNLRALYNRAVEKGITVQRNPFKHVYTGVDKTVKRALSIKMIRKIRDLDLSLLPSMDYARDMFMFSFYTRGMSFVDMAYLKKKNLQNGILAYRRQKTNQQLFIKWEKPMQDIIDKYDTSGTPYLLPIVKDVNSDIRRQYRNACHLVNVKLKKIGIDLGLPIVLTSYVARHTWASIAHSKNVSLSVISEAMGHDSENTTRIYLASLDMSVIDKANKMIIKSL